MRRRNSTLFKTEQPSLNPDAAAGGFNPIVSSLSRFRNLLWDFCAEIANPAVAENAKQIPWDFEIGDGTRFSDPKYSSLMLACKHLFYELLWHPDGRRRNKPNTIICHWFQLRTFIRFITNRRYPILRLKDVTKYVISEYMKWLDLPNGKGKKRDPATIYRYYYVLRLLYIHRRVIPDSLQFDPFDGESPAKQLGVNRSLYEQAKTDPIPDDMLSKLVVSSLDYVERFSEFLLKTNDAAERIRRAHAGSHIHAIGRRLRLWIAQISVPTDTTLETSFSLGVLTPFTLAEHLVRLRTACFILLAFVTGMRLSELLSLKVGCVETEDNEHGEFIWVNSILYKTQDDIKGTPTKWLGGPVAAKAVSVLERLSARVRRETGSQSLFVPSVRYGQHGFNGEAVAATAIGLSLQDYAEWLHLKDDRGNQFHPHPHMFRRTFARHVVRSDTTNLLALKRHFKHVSIAMTEHYVGIDEELQDILNDEADRLGFDSFDKVLRSDSIGGARGRELVKQIDAAIADGRLPLEFRGEAGAHLRKEMILEMIAAGQQVYPCPTGNFCWFRKDSALCTNGDRPLVEACNPFGCANSMILPEHDPQWEAIEEGGEKLLKHAPPGSPLSLRLHQIVGISKKIRSSIR